MRKFIKNLIVCFLIFSFAALPAYSKINALGTINHDFSINNISKEVHIISPEEIILPDETIIPKHSILTIETIQVQKERRWHKSAFIIGKIKNYIIQDVDTDALYELYKKELYEEDTNDDVLSEYTENQIEILPIKEENVYDISDKNVYVKIYKYWAVDKKEAAILATEIVITQGAAIVGSVFIYFAPVDIAYFFIKGAIQREKHPHWFKAGVFNAYDNSIFWFWLKGRHIEMEENSPVQIKHIKEEKAMKFKKKIEEKNEKQELKEIKKQIKYNKKQLKQTMKEEQKLLKKQEKLQEQNEEENIIQ